jgi:drug/metabolite transporter (DMT)-like permease
MPPVVLILLSVALSVVGQLLLKTGVSQLGALSLARGDVMISLRSLLANPIVWGGLAVYAVGTFFWLGALSRVELGYAYPFLSLSYVLVMLTSWIFLREEVSLMRVAGAAIICCGVYAVAGG